MVYNQVKADLLLSEKFAMTLHELLSQSNKYNLPLVMKELTIGKGESIYTPGSSTYYMYEIASGAVKLGSYGNQQQKVTYDVLSHPDTFGNLRYLNGQFFEFADSLMPTKLRAYQLDFFKRVIVEDPVISEWFNKTTVARWCVAETRLFKVRALSRAENLRSIVEELNQTVTDAKGRIRNILNELSMQDLGDLTGMTRQTVSNLLQQINKEKEAI